MALPEDLYGHKKKLKRAIDRIKDNEDILPENRNTIVKFKRNLVAEGIGMARIIRYLNDLPQIAILLDKPFEEATAEDFERIIVERQENGYSYNTMLDFKKTIKKFYKWLNKGTYPECVAWIKTGSRANNFKMPEELITEEEVKLLIESAMQPRDRAVISILWESGCRAGELLSLQIKSVVFEENISRIIVHGKTGMRRVPLIDSTPYLTEWLNYHPLHDDPDAPLWTSLGSKSREKPMTYPALRKMLSDLGKKTKIKKATNPHNFRHSRATVLAKHLTEAELNQYMGWVQGSNISSVYVHLSGRDMDSAILKLRGIQPKEEKHESSMAPRQCPRCSEFNNSTGKYCNTCGAILDVQLAMKKQDKEKVVGLTLQDLINDPEFQEYFNKKIESLKK